MSVAAAFSDCHVFGKAAAGPDDLPARGVADGECERQSGAVRCVGDALLQAVIGLAWHSGGVTDHGKTHVVLDQIRGLALDGNHDQVHQGIDFRLGPVPVFSGECIESEIAYAEFRGNFGDASHRVDSLYMAFASVETARFGPAPVAVHYDGYVARKAALVYFFCHIFYVAGLHTVYGREKALRLI